MKKHTKHSLAKTHSFTHREASRAHFERFRDILPCGYHEVAALLGVPIMRARAICNECCHHGILKVVRSGPIFDVGEEA